MAKTSNIFARVEPEIKDQAELVLNELGIPMSNAINIFLRQVILQKGLPFDVKLTRNKPLIYNEMTVEQFNDEIEKGMSDLENGRVVSAHGVKQHLHQEYGV
ncbi:MAG: type II toxin-antitoxin system RelB/DinJ family antitoxin [Epulopiscium sp.]|nr:type II toxin-antitoxin system RelB/DinJ family antitoxin [Candidatus Epulonipiscium sp.]